MLSMKTLKVAIVTMGSALLLGPGLASAIDLDGTGMAAPEPILIASQTISADADVVATGSMTATHHAIDVGDVDLEISPGIRLDAMDRYFLRVELGGGLIFDATPTLGTPITGGGGSNVFVTLLETVEIIGKITVEVNEALAVPSNAVADYTASMTVHNEQFDAVDGVGEIRSIGAQGVVIVSTVNGIASSVQSTTVTADVGAGFLWFVNPDAAARGTMPNVSNVGFGTASATANAADGVLNAGDGSEVSNNVATLINADGMRIAVTGDFSVGAFDLVSAALTDPNDPMSARDATCGTGDVDRVGTVGVPGMGALQPTEDDPTTAMSAWMAPGSYQLCLEVDVAGAMTNATALPNTEYTASVYTRTSETAVSAQAEGTIGVIMRNGASVNIPYLTTSDKHNQRLIIVNRGSRPISITNIEFNSEDGTEADLSDAAKAAAAIPGAGEIGPDETAVHSVATMLSITGDSRRTAATLSFNGRASDVSVATTQVNLADSSTDTVVYDVN